MDHINGLTERVIGAAIEVHRAMGPGLLESTYEVCLAAELVHLGLRVDRQVAVPVVYRDVKLECGYRMDMLVEERVVVELKVVARIEPVHVSQVLTYLRLSGCRVGLLINFNTPLLKAGGIRRLAWGHGIPKPNEVESRDGAP